MSSGSPRATSRGERRQGHARHLGRVLSDPPRESKTQKHQPTADKPERPSRDEKKKTDAEARKNARALQARRARIDELEARIAATENSIKELEQAMAAPGFYDDRAAAQPLIDRHQALMWEVGGLMSQWEELHAMADSAPTQDA